MLITKERTSLVKTRQRVTWLDDRGDEHGATFLVIGPATDGTWMVKALSDPSWTDVDTAGQCHNHFYDGRTRPVMGVELEAYEQHKAATSQLPLL
jgi:hypothetical protein